MLTNLLGFTESRNRQANLIKRLTNIGKGNFNLMADDMMTAAGQFLSLSLWELKGPPETWRSQLEEYNRTDPVFALIGGISGGEWEPIHRFSEEHRIPCLFPITDFPVISPTDWYTLYLSKGYYQEGEGAARYLAGRDEVLKKGPVVQIVRASREGEALSRGFVETWRELGHEAPVTVTLKAGEKLDGEAVQRLLAKEKPAVVILWDGPSAPAELELLSSVEGRPEMVFVSSGYLGKELWGVKEPLRDLAYITYPYRLSSSTQEMIDPMKLSPILSAAAAKTANQGYTLHKVLPMALMDMGKNYYRDTFLDVIGMMGDLAVPLYERLSFGPGQRYASKGCYIVQLSKGPQPKLVQKSDWVIH
jgi:hypothetical protein